MERFVPGVSVWHTVISLVYNVPGVSIYFTGPGMWFARVEGGIELAREQSISYYIRII